MPPYALIIPIVVFLIPILGILTQHQQKMAQLLNERGRVDPQELAVLREEMRQLRELVHQQTITMDSLMQYQRAAVESTVQDRLKGEVR